MSRIRSGMSRLGRVGGRRGRIGQRSKGVVCEITNPRSGMFMGYFVGTEQQLYSGGGCPCPGGGAILPGCCDLHEY